MLHLSTTLCYASWYAAVTISFHSTLPIHTVNHTPHLKSSNRFSFRTPNCFEQFCTAYNLVSRFLKKGKYSKMQNTLERSGTQTYFFLMTWWHSMSNLSTFFFFNFTFNLLLVFTVPRLNRTWSQEENHSVWFGNSEIPSNLCLNVLLFDASTAISRNTPNTFEPPQTKPTKPSSLISSEKDGHSLPRCP